jgi:hypothetical protein
MYCLPQFVEGSGSRCTADITSNSISRSDRRQPMLSGYVDAISLKHSLQISQALRPLSLCGW